MSPIHKRHVGRYEFTLFVSDVEQEGKWRWWLTRSDARESYFGRWLARGAAETEADAIAAVEAAFEREREYEAPRQGHRRQGSP